MKKQKKGQAEGGRENNRRQKLKRHREGKWQEGSYR